jgi:hypothetical protein
MIHSMHQIQAQWEYRRWMTTSLSYVAHHVPCRKGLVCIRRTSSAPSRFSSRVYLSECIVYHAVSIGDCQYLRVVVVVLISIMVCILRRFDNGFSVVTDTVYQGASKKNRCYEYELRSFARGCIVSSLLCLPKVRAK